MPTGRMQLFNSERGYGFITPDDGSTEVFVHVSSVHAAGLTTLKPGAAIAYEVATNPRNNRPMAVSLKLLQAVER